MASFLLAAGYPVAVYSRTAASRQRLVEKGAAEASDIRSCVDGAAIVFTCLPDDDTLRTVLLGAGGVLESASPSTILVETSTVSVAISAEVAAAAERRHVAYLRIPISGNAASAQRGEVTALVSGPADAWAIARPVVETFSQTQVYLGPGDEARAMKLVINALVVGTGQLLAESLALGRKSGLDWEAMLDTLARSTVASPWVKAKAELLKRRDFTTTMTTRLIMKDMDLILAAAREGDVPMPLTAVTRQLLQMLVGAGHGEDDFMRLVQQSEQQSGLDDGTG